MADTAADWIEWAGGECPVAQDALVQVRIGAINPVEEDVPIEAGCYLWQHEPEAVADDYQVIAYRVVPA